MPLGLPEVVKEMIWTEFADVPPGRARRWIAKAFAEGTEVEFDTLYLRRDPATGTVRVSSDVGVVDGVSVPEDAFRAGLPDLCRRGGWRPRGYLDVPVQALRKGSRRR